MRRRQEMEEVNRALAALDCNLQRSTACQCQGGGWVGWAAPATDRFRLLAPVSSKKKGAEEIDSSAARIADPSWRQVSFGPSSACGRRAGSGSHRAATGDGHEHARKLRATSRDTVRSSSGYHQKENKRKNKQKGLFFFPFGKSFSSTCA